MALFRIDPFEEIKIIFLGESGVGKSTIIKRCLGEKLEQNLSKTESLSFVEKTILLDNERIKLCLWDTSGQHRFRPVNKLFIKDSKIIILVFEMSSLESFENLNFWYDYLDNEKSKERVIGMIGNKSDLKKDENLTEEKIKTFAEKIEAFFYIFSAYNIKEDISIFIQSLVQRYIENIKSELIDDNFDNKELEYSIQISKKDFLKIENEEKNNCCTRGNKNYNRQRTLNNIIITKSCIIKMTVLGSVGVGKTCIIKKMKGENFNEKEKHTEKANSVIINYIIQGKKLVCTIWDTNGDINKKEEIKEILKDSMIYYLIFDIKQKNTFYDLKKWVKIIYNARKESTKAHILLVFIGNKSDLISNKEERNSNEDLITLEEAQKLANHYGGIFLATSAKNNNGINNIIGNSIERYLNSS